MEERTTSYQETNRMKDLIGDNSSLLMVMSRFGISLGFGDKTIHEICQEQHVDTNTFLTVANFISGRPYNPSHISLKSLIDYLKQAHDYFLDFNLPTIRRKMLEAINCSGDEDITFLMLKFFDEYAMEVRRHMEYENKTVFIYVTNLLNGIRNDKYSIDMFVSKHNNIRAKLTELKNLIIQYYPGKNSHLLNAVLFDIMNCEQDLASHGDVEDILFVPAVRELEKSVTGTCNQEQTNVAADDAEDNFELLSQREKDILVCVAKGMTNKEIADHLFLSVHTVTKHRYNITTKLQIHTPAGLTIYAIAHNLVNIQDLKLNKQGGALR